MNRYFILQFVTEPTRGKDIVDVETTVVFMLLHKGIMTQTTLNSEYVKTPGKKNVPIKVLERNVKRQKITMVEALYPRMTLTKMSKSS